MLCMKAPFLWIVGCLCLSLSIQSLYAVDDEEGKATIEVAYQQTLKDINKELEDYRSRYKAATKVNKWLILEELELFFTNSYKTINHFWYATPYDYNGMSEMPRSGEIACGYLISTIMKHAGFRVGRIKLAQQRATNVIYSLCRLSSINSYHRMDELKDYLIREGEGIYLVGLDTHIGSIEYIGGEMFFTHASPLAPQSVVQERLDESLALAVTTEYVVGKLSDNRDLMRKWMEDELISTVTNK